MSWKNQKLQIMRGKALLYVYLSSLCLVLYGYGIQIHIIENAAYLNEVRTIDSKGDHIAFRVADCEEIQSRLNAEGIPYIFKINAGGIPQVFIHDPDGHQIELAVVGDPSIGYEPDRA